MKNLIVLLLLTCAISAQVVVKGITLGGDFDSTGFMYNREGYYATRSTMGGHKGLLMVITTSSNKVVRVVFEFDDTNDELLRYTIAKGVSEKFNIDIEWVPMKEEQGEEFYSVREGVLFGGYLYLWKKNGLPCLTVFRWTHMDSHTVWAKERHKKFIDDF